MRGKYKNHTHNNRITNGRCMTCNTKNTNGKVRCDTCAEEAKIRRQKNHHYRLNNNLCVRCSKNKVLNKKICNDCSKIIKVRIKTSNNKRKIDGKCKCGKDVIPGKYKCRNCCERKRLENKKTRDNFNSLGLCIKCGKNIQSKGKFCISCYEQSKNKRQQKKDDAFNVYGGYNCRCCGETEKEFLTLDHVNNDGAKHRKELAGRHIYTWLKLHNYPSGFQVLCYNCNLSKRFGKTCPHKLNYKYIDSSFMIW